LRGLRPGQLVRPLGAIVTLAPASVLLLLLGAFALACLTPLDPGDPPGDIARTLRDPLAWAGVAGAGAAGIVPAVIAAGLVTSPDRCLPRSRVMARFARTFAGVVAAVALLPAAGCLLAVAGGLGVHRGDALRLTDAAAAVAAAMPLLAAGWICRSAWLWREHRPGLCDGCAYPVQQLPRCPECGIVNRPVEGAHGESQA